MFLTFNLISLALLTLSLTPPRLFGVPVPKGDKKKRVLTIRYTIGSAAEQTAAFLGTQEVVLGDKDFYYLSAFHPAHSTAHRLQLCLMYTATLTMSWRMRSFVATVLSCTCTRRRRPTRPTWSGT